MFRILLIIALTCYALYKLGLLRVGIHSEVRGGNSHSNFNRRPSDGNVNIDSMPPRGKKKNFNDGEYVDYEEVE